MEKFCVLARNGKSIGMFIVWGTLKQNDNDP